MYKTFTKGMVILTLATSLFAAPVQPAEAGGRAGVVAGVAAGIIGLGILGAYANRPAYGYERSCYPGPERCGYAGRTCWENRYGETVCRGGEWRCYRPTYCN